MLIHIASLFYTLGTKICNCFEPFIQEIAVQSTENDTAAFHFFLATYQMFNLKIHMRQYRKQAYHVYFYPVVAYQVDQYK